MGHLSIKGQLQQHFQTDGAEHVAFLPFQRWYDLFHLPWQIVFQRSLHPKHDIERVRFLFFFS